MRKLTIIAASVLLLAGAAFAMKPASSDAVPVTNAGPSVFELMISAKDLPVAPTPEAI